MAKRSELIGIHRRHALLRADSCAALRVAALRVAEHRTRASLPCTPSSPRSPSLCHWGPSQVRSLMEISGGAARGDFPLSATGDIAALVEDYCKAVVVEEGQYFEAVLQMSGAKSVSVPVPTTSPPICESSLRTVKQGLFGGQPIALPVSAELAPLVNFAILIFQREQQYARGLDRVQSDDLQKMSCPQVITEDPQSSNTPAKGKQFTPEECSLLFMVFAVCSVVGLASSFLVPSCASTDLGEAGGLF